MLRQTIKHLIRRVPFVQRIFVALEFVLKRTLATTLWLAWRSKLYPFGFLRGKEWTPGRYYIEQFLKQYAGECHGHFLEFGDPQYRSLFAPDLIEHYDIINVQDGPDVTILGDIQNCPQVPSRTFDVIVCTQVLEHVANPFLAAAELRRILKPGGRLLVTVPAAYPYHAIPRDYWRFTRDSAQLLFGEHFHDVRITAWGNRLSTVAAYWFLMRDHLPQRALRQPDPDNPSLISVYARG